MTPEHSDAPANGQTGEVRQTTANGLDGSGQSEDGTQHKANRPAGLSGDAQLGAQGGTTKTSRAKSKSALKLENVEQLIAYAYSRKGRGVALKPQALGAIRGDLRLDEAAMQRLLAVSAEDQTLAVPRQLLLVARAFPSNPTVRGALRDFVRQVLLRHSLFGRQELVAAIQNLPDAPSVAQAIRLLASSEPTDPVQAKRKTKAKSGAFAELVSNAVNTLAVWFSDTRGLSPAALTEALFAEFWSKYGQIGDREDAQLRALTDITDLAGVAVACGAFRGEAAKHARQVEGAERENDTLRKRLLAQDAALDSSEKTVVALEDQIRQLRQALEDAQAQSATRVTHLKSDIEQQRTRVLRRLKADISLLDEALLALRREPPKVHVMDDHAERVVDSLREEVRRLESGG